VNPAGRIGKKHGKIKRSDSVLLFRNGFHEYVVGRNNSKLFHVRRLCGS
jgi:hypothetical protein